MAFKSFGIGLAGAIALLLPTASQAQEQHQVSVRNDVGQIVNCGIRRAGSSAVEGFSLRTGETWSKNYSGSKARLILCEGALSSWQQLAPDRTYRLVKTDAERIVAQLAAGG